MSRGMNIGKKLIEHVGTENKLPLFSLGYTTQNHYTLVEFSLSKHMMKKFHFLLITRRLKSCFTYLKNNK